MKEFRKLEDFLKIRITDSNSVVEMKKAMQNILKKNQNSLNWALPDKIFFHITHLRLLRISGAPALKKERIKNYMLWIENEALNVDEEKKKVLRVLWKACNRWIKAIERTGNWQMPPPIELYKIEYKF